MLSQPAVHSIATQPAVQEQKQLAGALHTQQARVPRWRRHTSRGQARFQALLDGVGKHSQHGR